MIQHFLSTYLFFHFIEPIRLLEDLVVHFQSSDTELIQLLEQLGIEVELDLSVAIDDSLAQLMDDVILRHCISILGDDIVFENDVYLGNDLVVWSLILDKHHIASQIRIERNQCDALDVTQVIEEVVEPLG